MEKRFGLKDLLLLMMIGVLIVVVLMAMKQYDRQWEVLDEIRKQGSDQNQQLAAIRRAVQSGSFAPRTTSSTGPTTNVAQLENDPFKYVREAQAMPGYAQGDWYVDNFPANVAKLTPLLATDLYARI